MSKLRAYHGDPQIKSKYVRRVLQHQRADQIVKGLYWQGGKGCAVGCTIHGSDHSRYETELGIPELLAVLQDDLFEALPNGEALTFPAEFLQAIPVGADLEPVCHRFLHWLLLDEEHGFIRFADDYATRDATQAVGDLHARAMRGELVQDSEWAAAEDTAWASRVIDWAGMVVDRVQQKRTLLRCLKEARP